MFPVLLKANEQATIFYLVSPLSTRYRRPSFKKICVSILFINYKNNPKQNKLIIGYFYRSNGLFIHIYKNTFFDM